MGKWTFSSIGQVHIKRHLSFLVHHHLIRSSFFQAWDLCVAGGLLEFIDPMLHGEPQNAEIIRCVQIALLCVQEDPEERPSMSDVLLMLSSDNNIQKQPNRPAYYWKRDFICWLSSSWRLTNWAQNLAKVKYNVGMHVFSYGRCYRAMMTILSPKKNILMWILASFGIVLYYVALLHIRKRKELSRYALRNERVKSVFQ